MAKASKGSSSTKASAQRRNLFYVSLGVLVIKMIIILSIKFGGWMGSDAEGYVAGATAMLKNGFFAKDPVLSHLPAGYPILIWLMTFLTHTGSFISDATSLVVVSIFQSVFYFAACAYFVERIRKSRLRKFAIPTAVFLGVNPTLTLSSLVVGYESIVASCMILSIALIMDFRQNQAQRSLGRTIILVGLLQSLAGFTQPRELLIGISLLIMWGLFQKSRKMFLKIVIAGSIVMLILPLALVARNFKATGSAVLSTQLGATMSAGAGDDATGGFMGRLFVTCPPKPNGETASDSELVGCVLSWYVHHPLKSAGLMINKTVFFWSPWSGPLANGTMARNPWLKIDPIINISASAVGHTLVTGWFGKTVSWIWLLGGLLLLCLGSWWLWQQGGLERELSLLISLPVALATLISVGTIGDHRYRIPTMGMSLLLQIVGFSTLKGRIFRGGSAPTLKPRGRAR
jgi:hypothetical protein